MKNMILLFSSVTLTSLFLEFLLIGLYLNHEQVPAGKLKSLMRSYYFKHDFSTIQFEKSCSQFDRKFFYRLKPNNTCIFKNREFSTTIKSNSINSRGELVTAPEIIFIGDSYTMGWGVERDERFSNLVSNALQLKGLNLSMSSYGTVRELMWLNDIDYKSSETLVIQYDRNDFDENKFFYEKKRLNPRYDDLEYNKYILKNQNNSSYFLGKGLLFFKDSFKDFIKQKISDKKRPVMWADVKLEDEVKYLLNALDHLLPQDKKRNIIIIDTTQRDNNLFKKELLKDKGHNFYKFVKNFDVIMGAEVLKEKGRFDLDDHLNKEGHKLLAQEIIKNLETLLKLPSNN